MHGYTDCVPVSLFALVLLASFCPGAIQTRSVSYEAGGVKSQGVLAWDDALAGKRPTVVIFPEWWGLTEYPKTRARQLAELGYLAFVADLYGQGKTTDDPKEAGKLSSALYAAPGQMRQRAEGALAAALAQPQADASRVAAIGYCMGGTVALHLARSGADLKAVVAFHAGLANRDPSLSGPIGAKVLVLNGADDKFESPQEYTDFENEMRKANADWLLVLYGGAMHSYTNPDADRHKALGTIGYNEKADKRSWQHMLGLFNETLGQPK